MEKDTKLINILLDNSILKPKEATEIDFEAPFQSIYNSITTSHEEIRYRRRRMYFSGELIQAKAKKIIDQLTGSGIIESKTSIRLNKLLCVVKNKVNEEEKIVDSIGVWQYLAEKEILESDLQTSRLNKYLRGLKINEILFEETNAIDKYSNQNDLIVYLRNVLIIEKFSRFKKIADFNEVINSKGNITELGIVKFYKGIIPKEKFVIDYYNEVLKSKNIDKRLMVIKRQDSSLEKIDMIGIIPINYSQYKAINALRPKYEYPFFNLNWFVIENSNEVDFEDVHTN